MSQQLVENAPVRPKRKMFRLDEVQRLHVSTVGRETPVRPKKKLFRFDEIQRLHVSTVGREGPAKTEEKDVQIR